MSAEPRQGIPAWVWILLTVFLAGTALAVVMCGGVLAFVGLSYQRAANDALIIEQQAVQADADALVAEQAKFRPEQVIPTESPIGPNAIPGLTIERLTEGMAQIGMSNAENASGTISYSGKGNGFKYLAFAPSENPVSIGHVIASVDPADASAEVDREALTGTALKLFENIALVCTEGQSRDAIHEWLTETSKSPGFSYGKEFGGIRLNVAWYAEPHAGLLVMKAPGEPETSKEITWKADEPPAATPTP